jgi:hypothetical protein
MIYQAKYQLGLQSYKAVQGIVEDFVGQGAGWSRKASVI